MWAEVGIVAREEATMLVAVRVAVRMATTMAVNSEHDRVCVYTDANWRCLCPPLHLSRFERATNAIVSDYRSQLLNY